MPRVKIADFGLRKISRERSCPEKINRVELLYSSGSLEKTLHLWKNKESL